MTTQRRLKSIITASLLAFSALLIPSEAVAKTKIGIYFGVPFYDGSMRDDYLYQPGYGWYAPEYRDVLRRKYGQGRVSCNEAARHLRNNGFRNIVAIECVGSRYTFQAREAGRTVKLSYNARMRSFGRI
jgi:hypothetical protein